MGAWMEDGDSAFEAIQQQADAGLDYMVNMILERVNEAEGSAPADNISGQANHEAGKSETTDNVFKGFGRRPKRRLRI